MKEWRDPVKESRPTRKPGTKGSLPVSIILPFLNFPADEVMRLRAHIDEAITDPDYSVVVSYECEWIEKKRLPRKKPQGV
jgi:hypothetical protein